MKAKRIEKNQECETRVSQLSQHEEGEPYLDNDGDVCATI